MEFEICGCGEGILAGPIIFEFSVIDVATFCSVDLFILLIVPSLPY